MENQVADHFSILKRKLEESMKSEMPWYAYFENYLTVEVVPPEATSHKLKKIFHDP
ncbi:unnamed protein product, partial [Citrullus colocynthis]